MVRVRLSEVGQSADSKCIWLEGERQIKQFQSGLSSVSLSHGTTTAKLDFYQQSSGRRLSSEFEGYVQGWPLVVKV